MKSIESSSSNKYLVLDTWAGRRHYKVEMLSETPKKYRIRILEPEGVMLPGRRYANHNDVVLVPKYAITDLPPNAKTEAE